MLVHKTINFHKQIDLNQFSDDFIIKKLCVCEWDDSRSTVIRANIDCIIVRFEDKLLLCPQSEYEEFVLYVDCVVKEDCYNDYIVIESSTHALQPYNKRRNKKIFDPRQITIKECPAPCCNSLFDCLSMPTSYCEKHIRKYF